MLTAEQSLVFILNRVEEIGAGPEAHHRAAHRARHHLTQRWAEPTDGYVDNDLEMAQRIGQDLADIQRRISEFQHAYLKALFGDEGG